MKKKVKKNPPTVVSLETIEKDYKKGLLDVPKDETRYKVMHAIYNCGKLYPKSPITYRHITMITYNLNPKKIAENLVQKTIRICRSPRFKEEFNELFPGHEVRTIWGGLIRMTVDAQDTADTVGVASHNKAMNAIVKANRVARNINMAKVKENDTNFNFLQEHQKFSKTFARVEKTVKARLLSDKALTALREKRLGKGKA